MTVLHEWVNEGGVDKWGVVGECGPMCGSNDVSGWECGTICGSGDGVWEGVWGHM